MNKYLRFKTGATTTAMVPIGAGAYAELTGTTEVKIFSCDSVGHHYSLATDSATFAMVTAIQAACLQGAQTSWVKAVVDVDLPVGETVTGITVTVF
tara:strand:+ start:457 stop:744 length:288 start_codon:yes stop_codon:yes gene_type:complete